MVTCLATCRWRAVSGSRSIITTTSLTKFRHGSDSQPRIPRSKIRIHNQLPGPTQKDTMAAVQKSLLDRFDPAGERQALIAKKRDALRVGQVLSIYAYNNYPALTPISIFSGYLIGIKRAGIESSIRLRTRVMRIGTEMRFPLYSPTIKEIKIIKATPPKKIRRAKLFYMRDEKHDKGGVDAILKGDRDRKEGKDNGIKQEK